MGTPASEFVRSDAHLQPLSTATVQNTSSSSLVNSPPTFVFPKDSLIRNTSSRDPTPEQEKALATLKDHHNSDIIAWHRLSQSTEPGLRHRGGPGSLPIHVIHAISTLRDCSRECLLQWLESCTFLLHRCPKNVTRLTALIANQASPPSLGLAASRFAAAASSRQTRRPSPRSDHTSSHRSLVKPVKAISPHLSKIPHSALAAAQNHLDPGQTFSRAATHSTLALVKPTETDHTYRCTVCDNHSFQHSDGWKKHEKEHETKYVCMLKGLFEITEGGWRCVLCGALNQDDSHHLVHNIAPCVIAEDRPSFKRRYEMVWHLKDVHGTTDGICVAEKWRCETSKNAWSCGFCIHLFSSLQDRLKHIGAKHFENGQSINDWNFTMVIQGLLLQPEIQEAWQRLLESFDPFRPSETKWNKLGCEDLQYRLEMGVTGKETPQSLAKAAYDSAEYDWCPAQHDAMASATTMNTLLIPYQHTSQGFSAPFEGHAVASGETPLQYPPWSSPQYQASEIPTNAPNLENQSSYGAHKSNVNTVPALDHSPAWKPIPSNTDDKDSTQPTTPFNDNTFYPADPSIYGPWNGYNITPSPAFSDQKLFHHKSNEMSDWSANPQLHTALGPTGSTLKRPRDSASSPAEAVARESSSTDEARKKGYRKRSDEDGTASRGFDLEHVHGRIHDDEGAPGGMRANRLMHDDV